MQYTVIVKVSSGALSGSQGREAMESAFLTTQLGTELLLERENSSKIRTDRFQQWLFQFYPLYPDLISKTEKEIEKLGGSNLELQSGQLLRLLKPLMDWKGVRKLQYFAYSHGWNGILRKKESNRFKILETNSHYKDE